VEFSIARQALLDAGWNGITPLNFQVFTTRDGTGNSPVGAGDIGGRNDIRDTIYDDFQAEDYYRDQGFISQEANAVLQGFFGLNASNDRGRRAKVVSIIHGNQALQPGNVTQDLINNGFGAGYYRPLDAHQAYNTPLTMHITPTLASAVQWAKSASGGFRDGPTFNARLAQMMSAGTIELLGSTISDHMLGYFPTSYNADNVALANSFLTSIYGVSPSTKVFWTPERVSDSGVLQKANELGFTHTFVDQMRHAFKWFGRTSALSDDGYRINQINNTRTLMINDSVSSYLGQNLDSGLPGPLRQLLNRKARSGQQDQALIFVKHWEEFGTKADADAYDQNLRWLASHPWVQIVTPDRIVSNQVDTSLPPDGVGDAWGQVTRGHGLALPNVSKDYVDHATQENYDQWYFGSVQEESLRDKVFNIRTGAALPTSYGQVGANGIANQAWGSIAGLIAGPANNDLLALGRATFHASVFETAFHNQTNNDLSKFSTGAYINPDTTFQTLAGFAKIAQSQSRHAAIYSRVNAWSSAANSGLYNGSSASEQTDVDLDGELEYLLFNDRVFALFERIGGRMTAAWLRDINSGYVTQVVGNPASYAGSETEEEGAGNFAGTAVNAHRTSGFKDWFAKLDAQGNGTFGYVNDHYSVTAAPSGIGWTFTSADGRISKTITLGSGTGALAANYTTSNIDTLFIRFGLSPDLQHLLRFGQSHLSGLITGPQQVNLFNHAPGRTVRAYLQLNSGGTYNPAASDRDANVLDTVNMRNQAQTQQVELQGSGTMTFLLGFETGAALTYDSDGDGLPDWFETQYGLDPNSDSGNNGANADPDGDGRTNLDEYVIGSNPTLGDAATEFYLKIARPAPGTTNLKFATIRDRVYRLYASPTFPNASWTQVGNDIPGTGDEVEINDTVAVRRYYKLEVSLP
ncbi:MAG TPA: hypothetical protein VG095_06435, partial [Chthoniobacterales bacterium]|nr:hypothetical protein [Chthoniobacterales bacterium]